MCKLIENRLNVLVVNEQLKKFDVTEEPAQAVLLTLHRESKKYKWPANSPFPAIIRKTVGGDFAVCNAVTGKKELIDFRTVKMTPLGKKFEYKGHVYEAEFLNGIPRYRLRK